MSNGYTLVDIEDPAEETDAGTRQVDLTEQLGSQEIAARMWYLSPGDEITYHRETAQEELYYQVKGPGRMRIDGELIDVPEGAIVRLPPETPRQPLNDTGDSDHVWLILGAPADQDEAEYLDP
ncbi:MAG: cupin domain-containing protein [Halobacteriales archaeon]